ncbi:hypothetical protein [Enterococcus mundtii]|nr:hypothetical protein [Enterococcus mundtii]
MRKVCFKGMKDSYGLINGDLDDELQTVQLTQGNLEWTDCLIDQGSYNG